MKYYSITLLTNLIKINKTCSPYLLHYFFFCNADYVLKKMNK